MGKLYNHKIFIFLVITIPLLGQRELPIGRTLTQGSLYNELTEGIAYRLKYFTLYRELRLAADNALLALVKATEKKIADLLFEYNDHHANMIKRSMGYYIDDLSRRFDNFFEAIEYKLLYQGASLDYHSAALEEKEQFINQLKIALKRSIGDLLQEAEIMKTNILA